MPSITSVDKAQKQQIPDFTEASQVDEIYTGFICKKLKETKEFYIRWFKMQVIFESSWFILLQTGEKKKFHIAFMHEKHPSSPPSDAAFKGGVWLTLQVADAKTEYEMLQKAGIQITYHLKDEPWGQRRFGVTDPNGIYIDVVEQTEPQKGYWEKYPATEMK